jgi:hypothetical protein
MFNHSNLDIRIIGRSGVEHLAEKENNLYAVSGLSSEDACIIGYAGRNTEGKRQWSLLWHRNATRIPTPDRTFDSPEDALAAAVEVHKNLI